MKVFFKIFIIVASISLISLYLIFIKDWLPYGWELSKNDSIYYVKDDFFSIDNPKYIVFMDGDYVDRSNELGGLKKLLKYTTNELGLVVYVSLEGGGFSYISVKPVKKKYQNIVHSKWDYKVYTPEEYDKLNLGWSWWHKIQSEK